MMTALVAAAPIEVVAVGDTDSLQRVPAKAIRHGENIYVRYGWKDPTFLPEVVAVRLERDMIERGFVPAQGEERMVYADPQRYAVTINYQERSPDFPVLATLIAGLGIGGGTFVLVRRYQIIEKAKKSLKPAMIAAASFMALVAIIAVPRLLERPQMSKS